ncbi:MAG: hypothetical protein ACTSU5_19650 [Promethearchaeota archaeon]
MGKEKRSERLEKFVNIYDDIIRDFVKNKQKTGSRGIEVFLNYDEDHDYLTNGASGTPFGQKDQLELL